VPDPFTPLGGASRTAGYLLFISASLRSRAVSDIHCFSPSISMNSERLTSTNLSDVYRYFSTIRKPPWPGCRHRTTISAPASSGSTSTPSKMGVTPLTLVFASRRKRTLPFSSHSAKSIRSPSLPDRQYLRTYRSFSPDIFTVDSPENVRLYDRFTLSS